MDARSRVLTQFPDVEQKIKILELTDSIPNDPVVVRKDLAPELSNKIRDAFIACIGENPEAFKGLNNSTGLAAVKDAEYDGLRATVKSIGIDIEKSLQ
jgi:phosphonate transport system substrate-binding protein